MDTTGDIREFLTSSRERIAREQPGLVAYGRNRRVSLPGDIGQRILVYSAEPGSLSQRALDLLASWSMTSATHRPEESGGQTLTTKEN
jgi:hypothetical protein